MRGITRYFLLITLLLSLLLSACSGGGQETAAAPETTAAPETVPAETKVQESSAPAPSETEGTSAPGESTAANEEPSVIEAPRISADDFPVTDGSTATLPLSWMLYRLCTGEDQEAAEAAMKFTKTNNAYLRLMDKEADLVIAYEPGPNAKADERYDDILMEPIGLDALIFLCNTSNPVTSLTSDEIRDIYTGRITNWKDVGGEDSEIIAFQREQNSGSQTLMENLMMQGEQMADAPIELKPSEMGDLIASVARYANTGNALGYSVYFYARNMYTRPNLRFMAVDSVMPSNDNIRSGDYAYSNPFYAAIRRDEPRNSKAYELFSWLTGEDGQSLIEAMDYVSLTKGTKKLPDDMTGKTSLLPEGLEGNTHRLAVNSSSYDGTAGVVFLDKDGQYMGSNDLIRIRDNDLFALIRGSVFPACSPAYAEPASQEEGDTEAGFDSYAARSIPIGLYDADRDCWAVEPVYDYCHTECTDGDHVIFYMGNWWFGGTVENGEYVYTEEPEAEMYLYDENGGLLGTKEFSGWEGYEEMISETLLHHHVSPEYYEDTNESVYQLGEKTRFIDSYLNDEHSCVLEINGRMIAAGSGGYVLPYMSDFISEDQIADGYNLVYIYNTGYSDGEYFYHGIGQYVIDPEGNLLFTLTSNDENIELVDPHFLMVYNYKISRYRIIDYAGKEVSSWIAPSDYEYTDW